MGQKWANRRGSLTLCLSLLVVCPRLLGDNVTGCCLWPFGSINGFVEVVSFTPDVEGCSATACLCSHSSNYANQQGGFHAPTKMQRAQYRMPVQSRRGADFLNRPTSPCSTAARDTEASCEVSACVAAGGVFFAGPPRCFSGLCESHLRWQKLSDNAWED